MEKQIKLFLEFLKQDKKLSDNTLQSYKRDIEQFEKYLDSKKLNYSKITEDDIKEYMEDHYSFEYSKKLLYDNPKKIFEGKKIIQK